jgi:ATP-dependent HslUV protease, peptidase subunit HslV
MGESLHGTTILAVRRGGLTALGGDGQVTNGSTVMKSRAVKIRRLQHGGIVAGFAGSVADALTLFDRFEARLSEFSQLRRAAVELAKDWRSDRYLRRLEAMLICADRDTILLLSGSGEVIEPDPGPLEGDSTLAVGSGGSFALAASRALLAHSTLSAKEIVQQSLEIAADLCIYTNRSISIEEVGG